MIQCMTPMMRCNLNLIRIPREIRVMIIKICLLMQENKNNLIQLIRNLMYSSHWITSKRTISLNRQKSWSKSESQFNCKTILIVKTLIHRQQKMKKRLKEMMNFLLRRGFQSTLRRILSMVLLIKPILIKGHHSKPMNLFVKIMPKVMSKIKNRGLHLKRLFPQNTNLKNLKIHQINLQNKVYMKKMTQMILMKLIRFTNS